MIGNTAIEPRFRQERIAGMKRVAESPGYELVPQAQPKRRRRQGVVR